MECRKSELDITKVTVAVPQRPVTCFTLGEMVRCPQSRIQRSMSSDRFGCSMSAKIIEMSIIDFDDTLADNVLAGQEAKLEGLDAFRVLVMQLLLFLAPFRHFRAS